MRGILAVFVASVLLANVVYFHPAHAQDIAEDVTESSPIFWVILGVNFLLVAATVSQVYLQRQEIRNRTRPWLGRREDESGDLQLLELEKTVKIRLFNHGSLPARNVTVSSYIVNDKPSTTRFDSSLIQTSEDPYDMPPKEGFTHYFDIPGECKMVEGSALYFGLRVTYSSGKRPSRINGTYEITAHWDKNTKEWMESVDYVTVK